MIFYGKFHTKCSINYRKFDKFDIGSDVQNATFSEKLEKNNRRLKKMVCHTLGNLYYKFGFIKADASGIREVIEGVPS